MAVPIADKRSVKGAVGTGSERVTWLLPVKDGMPYLRETLASIADQTYTNWEVLAWDNGSTDGSAEELRRWIPERLPGRVIADRPMPLALSLAEMVELADTELCARIDADDINNPTRLERQVAYLREHPEVALVGTWVERIDDASVNHGLYSPFPKDHRTIVFHMFFANAIFHPTVLLRRSAVLKAGNYRDVGPAEDYELWLRMAAEGLALSNMEETLVYYRVHDKGASFVQHAQGVLLDAIDGHVSGYAEILYGCTEEDCRLLRQRRHPRAGTALLGIGRHLGLERSSPFFAAARSVVAPADIRSRLAIAALNPNPLALPMEVVSIAARAIAKIARPVWRAFPGSARS